MRYCKEHQGYQPIETKTIQCIDCGKEVVIDSKANNRTRCEECTLNAKRKFKREWKQRNKKKNCPQFEKSQTPHYYKGYKDF